MYDIYITFVLLGDVICAICMLESILRLSTKLKPRTQSMTTYSVVIVIVVVLRNPLTIILVFSLKRIFNFLKSCFLGGNIILTYIKYRSLAIITVVVVATFVRDVNIPLNILLILNKFTGIKIKSKYQQ
uniref:Uncharacterized protein n=1 Tax=Glossina austeni TaxID=7395 RepID=A0A1A9UDZ5_GLOAU